MAHISDLNKEQIEEYKETFEMFDLDKDGTITADELQEVMKSMGRLFSRKEVKEMIAEVDVDDSGSIEFDEFLLMMCRDEDSEFELLEAFKVFDKDGDGEVTANEVRDVLAKFGQKLSDAELEAMMAEVDRNGDGVISFAEFKQLMGN